MDAFSIWLTSSGENESWIIKFLIS